MENSLYQQDFVLWVEQQARQLEQQQFATLDWQNLAEEILALGRSEKQQLENRLEVLLEHLLKRCYVNSTYDNRGWELTIKEQRKQIQRLFRTSPSLKIYFREVFNEIWQDALSDVQDLYPSMGFSQQCPFSDDPDLMLTEVFWRQL